MKRAARRDLNEDAIVGALRSIGATICRLSMEGAPDLLVGFRGQNYLLEVKRPRGKRTPAQIVWHRGWSGQVQVVETVEQALRLICGADPQWADAEGTRLPRPVLRSGTQEGQRDILGLDRMRELYPGRY